MPPKTAIIFERVFTSNAVTFERFFIAVHVLMLFQTISPCKAFGASRKLTLEWPLVISIVVFSSICCSSSCYWWILCLVAVISSSQKVVTDLRHVNSAGYRTSIFEVAIIAQGSWTSHINIWGHKGGQFCLGDMDPDYPSELLLHVQ